MQDKLVVYGNITVDRVIEKKGRKPVLKGHSPGGAINVAHYLKELTNRDQVLLVSNIGDDDYASMYIEPELEKMNDNYVQRVKNGKTRLYQVDITKPTRPSITRLEEARGLMDTPYRNITPVLPSVSTIHFQSYATIFENKYRDGLIELIRKIHEMNIPVNLDWNKRKYVESKETLSIQKKILDVLDTLKMNESEAKSLVEPKEGKTEKIRLRSRELERLADEIMDNYTVKRVVITLSDRGSYVQTRGMNLRFDALKPLIIMDTTGTGDAVSAAYGCERIKNLDEIETGVLSQILGCLAVENMFSFPNSIKKTVIRQYIINRHDYCKKYKVEFTGLLKKLGL